MYQILFNTHRPPSSGITYTQMEIKAEIYKIGETVQVTEKFKKRELIVKTEASSQYPQHIKVQFSQDKCSLAESFRVGQEATFYVNLRGRLYTDKNGNENTVTNLEVWKVEAGEVPIPQANGADIPQSNGAGLPATDILDDLPF